MAFSASSSFALLTSNKKLQSDNKRVVRSNWRTFLICAFVILPLWSIVLLPTALLSQAVISLKRSLRKKTTSTLKPVGASSFKASLCPKLETRKFDLILLGATGFTGGLAARYLAEKYNVADVKWALAGRNIDALKALRNSLANEYGDHVKKVDLIIVNTSDVATVEAMVVSTRVVATSVGPYTKYGSSVVAACAAFGTSYVDITGETGWIRKMIAEHDATARATGARIVHSTGHDSLPWDISVAALINEFSARGEDLVSVEVGDEFRSQVSGGTLDTMVNVMSSIGEEPRHRYNPLLMNELGEKSSNILKMNLPLSISWSSALQKWTGAFLMAYANADIVKRSYALRKERSLSLIYREGASYVDFKTAFVKTLQLATFITSLSIPPLRYMLHKFVLPKPGTGPPMNSLSKGFLRVTSVGLGSKGNKINSCIYIPGDPGYIMTSRMFIESGLALALDADKLPSKGGVLTPASAFGTDVILKRLSNIGIEFAISDC